MYKGFRGVLSMVFTTPQLHPSAALVERVDTCLRTGMFFPNALVQRVCQPSRFSVGVITELPLVTFLLADNWLKPPLSYGSVSQSQSS